MAPASPSSAEPRLRPKRLSPFLLVVYLLAALVAALCLDALSTAANAPACDSRAMASEAEPVIISPAEPHSRAKRLFLPLAACLLAAFAAVLCRDCLPVRALATATKLPAIDARAMVSEAAAGASHTRDVAVAEVLAAEIARPTPVPTPVPTPTAVPTPAPRPSPAPAPVVVDPPPATSDGAVRGIATWYGGSDGYDSDDTMADGSLFNPDDPTIVAANDWPLGASLLVCHDERCIRVRVRDHGSFSQAVDLSRGAFALLAPLSSGVIDVTVQPLS
ncbi:MAG: septal ring lytic transglycosylase RlpA family protein [Dehalococcoidia bacterium]